ncbi:MAG: cation:proton antiporter [Gammaproteobacteria bacterium]|nr:cation:proton antiporter [Gammaproteobacteria bacterium]NND38142.1 cation:proton antiporter [Pseudomonadales bacterium]NNL10985.1 cation:proton antiporter [Pseudomonadales bacterium]NNM11642.1 cation:proton antiporter [Pseudomonadales bacterium]RZV52464.1 MAG: cation:proton antiporter [Pseudomonadales bacterium]
MHASDSIELQISLLLFCAMAGYLLASYIRQPAVVGQILLGIIIGPSVLGLVSYTTLVSNLAHIGAIVLLFVVGLEFRLKDILQWRYMVIGLFGVFFPLIGGVLLARAFGFESAKAIFLGICLTATSIAITADTLRETGQLNSNIAKAIIGAAIIDDILALLALSVGSQYIEGTVSLGNSLFFLAKGIAFFVVGAWIGQRYISRLLVVIDNSQLGRKYTELAFIAAMMLAFLFAIAAELVGLSAIIGAFVAGVALEGIKLQYSKDFKEGAEFVRILFAAIFFVSLGVLLDVSALDRHLLGFLAAITVFALLSKIIGCGLPARFLGYDNRESLAIGIGMAPRGEVSMVIALLGLNLGIIEQPLYVVIVLMSVLTTLVTPPALRALMSGDNATSNTEQPSDHQPASRKK